MFTHGNRGILEIMKGKVGKEMMSSSIKDWAAAYGWEPIDTDCSAEEWVWWGSVPCGMSDGVDDHEFDADGVQCTHPEHGSVVGVELARRAGLAQVSVDATVCYLMEEAAARVLVEAMHPGVALEWVAAHAVRLDRGMSYHVDRASAALLLTP